MSYKFQLGNAQLSGALLQEGSASNGFAIIASGGVNSLSDAANRQHISASGDVHAFSLKLDGNAATLSKTALGSTVTISSLEEVGALSMGSIATGFGNIDNGTSNITTGGKLTLDVLGTDIDEVGALTMGTAQQGALYAEATGPVLDAKTGLVIDFAVAGVKQAHIDVDGIDLITGNEYLINNVSVLNATTLGSNVVASSLTSVGTIATGVWNGDAIADAYVADDLTIAGGTINNTPIGASTPSSIRATDYSGSGTMQNVGLALFGGTLSVTGAVSGAVAGTFGTLTADGGFSMQSQTIISAGRGIGNVTTYSGSGLMQQAGDLNCSSNLSVTGALVTKGIVDLQGAVSKPDFDVADLQTDSFYLRDNDDSGRMKRVLMDDLFGFMADGTTITATNGVLSATGAGDNISVNSRVTGQDLLAGLNYVAADLTGSVHVFLPAVAAAQDGDIVIMKGNAGTSGVNTIKISPQAGDKVEGVANQFILLESPDAAVKLIYVDGQQDWMIV